MLRLDMALSDSDDMDNFLAEVDHGTVDVHPPVLLVPLDGVEVPAARLVDGAGERHSVTGQSPHLVPQSCRGEGDQDQQGAEQ